MEHRVIGLSVHRARAFDAAPRLGVCQVQAALKNASRWPTAPGTRRRLALPERRDDLDVPRSRTA
jgi:hypothetical protein